MRCTSKPLVQPRDPASKNTVENDWGRLPTSAVGVHIHVHTHAPTHVCLCVHAYHTCVHMRPGEKNELKPTAVHLPVVLSFFRGKKIPETERDSFCVGCLNICRQPSPPSCTPPIFIFMFSTVKPSSSSHSYSVFGKQMQNLYLHLLNLILSEEIQIVDIRHNSISLAMKKVSLKKWNTTQNLEMSKD